MASVTTTRKENFVDRFARTVWESRQAYIYILPAFIIMAFITFYPIGYQLWMAFTNFRLEHLRLQNPDVVGFQNFLQILRSGLPVPNFSFGRILIFNIVWTFVNVFLHAALGIAIALALNSETLPGKRIYRSLFVIPWALPALISGMVWHNMWHERFGAVNLLLQQLGMAGDIRWLLETDPLINLPQIGLVLPLSFFAVLIANVWLGWPFMMVVATGALQAIPAELYEAASIDGASAGQKLRRITIPLIRPAMVPAIMLGTIMTFNQFNVIYFISEGGPFGRTEILITQAFKLVYEQRLYGVAAAFSIVVFFVLLIITLLQNRVTRATEAYYV
jgi:arabinogalactan oligomer/maltooligosaccharide transport system permease protein